MIKRIFYSIGFMFLCIPWGMHAFAAEFEDLKIRPELPLNQEKGVTGYFSLDMADQETLDLHLDVENMSDEDIDLHVYAGEAVTTQSGIITVMKRSEIDHSLLVPEGDRLADLIEVKKKHTVRKHSKKRIPIHVHAPSKKEGTHLAGVLVEFTQKSSGQESESLEDAPTVTVNNVFRQAFAIQLNYDHTPKALLEIGEGSVQDLQGIQTLQTTFVNDKQELLKMENVEILFKDHGEWTTLASYPNFKLTPFASLPMEFPYVQKPLEEGQLAVRYSVRGEEYFLETNLLRKQSNRTITNPVQRFQRMYPQEKNYTWAALAVLAVVGVAFLVARNRKRKTP